MRLVGIELRRCAFFVDFDTVLILIVFVMQGLPPIQGGGLIAHRGIVELRPSPSLKGWGTRYFTYCQPASNWTVL